MCCFSSQAVWFGCDVGKHFERKLGALHLNMWVIQLCNNYYFNFSNMVSSWSHKWQVSFCLLIQSWRSAWEYLEMSRTDKCSKVKDQTRLSVGLLLLYKSRYSCEIFEIWWQRWHIQNQWTKMKNYMCMSCSQKELLYYFWFQPEEFFSFAVITMSWHLACPCWLWTKHSAWSMEIHWWLMQWSSLGSPGR